MLGNKHWDPPSVRESELRRGERVAEEMVSLMSDHVEDSEKDQGDLVKPRRSSSLESEITVVVAEENNYNKIKSKQGSPLKSVRLAVDDVSACRHRIEKLESDLLHAADSLQFNSVDMQRYKRNMDFVETLTPMVSKANAHAGSASRVSTELLKVLQDHTTTVHTHGSSPHSAFEHIGPLVTSVSHYMMLVEESVKEAIAFVEKPDSALEDLRDKMKLAVSVCSSIFGFMFVLFVISTIRASRNPRSGFPVAVFVFFCALPLSMGALVAIMILLKSKERAIREQTDDWALRDTALESLKRVQPILAHFSECQNFKMMVPDMVRNRSSELSCSQEEWDEIMTGNVSQTKNDLLRNSGRGRATIEIRNLTCL